MSKAVYLVNGAPQANGTNGVQVQPAQRNGTGVR
jgi:hypothetical protein